MTIEILADADAVARRAAETIADAARAAVQVRGRFLAAISGGRTPWLMLRMLSAMQVPWSDVHLLQVDERIAPEGHMERNLTHLRDSLRGLGPHASPHIHAMPVDAVPIEDAAARYAQTLVALAGSPPVLDLVHLGLGSDGHTASLVPGDPVLEVVDADVAVTQPYQGRRRMTLTYPVLNLARRVVWLVTGDDKRGMLMRLSRGDLAIPAGRVRRDCAVVLADVAAAPPGEVPRPVGRGGAP